MIVRFRSGNMAETGPVHEKLDHDVSAARKRDGYKQLPVSVEFTTNYKNIYLICIFLIRFIYYVHIVQVFYNINTSSSIVLKERDTKLGCRHKTITVRLLELLPF